METITLLVVFILAFVLGVSAGHTSLKNTLEKNGYALVYKRDKISGKSTWRVYRRTLFDLDGTTKVDEK